MEEDLITPQDWKPTVATLVPELAVAMVLMVEMLISLAAMCMPTAATTQLVSVADRTR